MKSLSFYIVDVFALTKYTGNQLAVFTNAEGLTSDDMQSIAREINYSETTFIMSQQPVEGGYNVRIFTPEYELPFAGHPTLGTAFILQQAIFKQSIEKVILNLGVGQIPVIFDGNNHDKVNLWMQQKAPKFDQIFPVEAIAETLRLDIDEIDTRYPIQAVSTGIPFIIVPLKTLAALKRTKIDRDKYLQLISGIEAKCILVFCPETYYPENQLNVRVFCDYLGVPEDPATGSANGCLAGYLVEYSYFGKNEINLRVEQGYEIKRPSLLLIKASVAAPDKSIEVHVGGTVIMVAKGEFL
jgi:trans-2,3-dihydro-3-hydroxyanthranilate isomerase